VLPNQYHDASFRTLPVLAKSRYALGKPRTSSSIWQPCTQLSNPLPITGECMHFSIVSFGGIRSRRACKREHLAELWQVASPLGSWHSTCTTSDGTGSMPRCRRNARYISVPMERYMLLRTCFLPSGSATKTLQNNGSSCEMGSSLPLPLNTSEMFACSLNMKRLA
jgi:hypothetical protein